MEKLLGFRGSLDTSFYTELKTNNLVIQRNIGSLENPQLEEVPAIEREKLAEIISDTLATWALNRAQDLNITDLKESKRLWKSVAKDISKPNKRAIYRDLATRYVFFGILRLTERYQSKLTVSNLEVTYDNMYTAIYYGVMNFQDSIKSDDQSDSRSTRISGILAKTIINSWLSRLEIVTSGAIINHLVNND